MIAAEQFLLHRCPSWRRCFHSPLFEWSSSTRGAKLYKDELCFVLKPLLLDTDTDRSSIYTVFVYLPLKSPKRVSEKFGTCINIVEVENLTYFALNSAEDLQELEGAMIRAMEGYQGNFVEGLPVYSMPTCMAHCPSATLFLENNLLNLALVWCLFITQTTSFFKMLLPS